MGRIVAIASGDLLSTRPLNKYAVKLSRRIITMSLTKNPNVLKWVEEMTALTKPDKVVWIDGSKEQIDALKA